MLGRVVRGVPSDIAWRAALELTPRRFTWHVRNPSTAITTLFVVMFPLNMVADSAGRTPSSFIDYRVPLWVLTDLFGCVILVFAALAIAVRVVPGLSTGADAYRGRTRLERGRRTATAAMGVAWAGSAVFRFGSASLVGAGFWAAFGLCLFFYLLLLTVGLGVRLLTLGRYLPKVAS